MPDNFNRSTVEVDFEDVYHQPIRDDVVIQIYNTQIQSLKQRFEVQFQGKPVLLADVPAAPTGQAKFVITPKTYEFKQFFYSVQSGRTNSLMQVFFVDPNQAKPRLIDFGDIAGKAYGADLLPILAGSGINQSVWNSLDKRNRATILNLSAKMSKETIADGTRLIKLLNSIDRTWLDKKHRERIFARQRSKYRPATTDSRHGGPIAPNRLHNLVVRRSNQVWVSDATAVLTGQGWLYLVAVLDVFTRRVVGWAMSQILDATLVIAALRMALGHRRPAKTLILHSDRGAQFASAAYRQVLAQHGLVPSMSRKANCYDNAFIESFFSSLKYELVYHHRFVTRAQARTAIFDYIETFYNRTRLHSSLDYQSPINFESKLN
jgi:transposase InsO family protein